MSIHVGPTASGLHLLAEKNSDWHVSFIPTCVHLNMNSSFMLLQVSVLCACWLKAFTEKHWLQWLWNQQTCLCVIFKESDVSLSPKTYLQLKEGNYLSLFTVYLLLSRNMSLCYCTFHTMASFYKWWKQVWTPFVNCPNLHFCHSGGWPFHSWLEQ